MKNESNTIEFLILLALVVGIILVLLGLFFHNSASFIIGWVIIVLILGPALYNE